MVKVLLVLNHVQAGMGSDENADLPPAGKKSIIGPGKMMEPYFKEMDGEIVATLYCGDLYYQNNEEEVKKKFVAMAKKLSPDVVVCGPALHYPNFGEMAGGLAEEINNKSDIPAFAAMSLENPATEKYKDKVIVVKTPKKGGVGLNQSIENICKMAVKLAKKENVEDLKREVCF
ncbi:glycine/betaine/sarcosine/D-proline family reductase selenoprotein B [Clostridium sardiniense]|uniref:Glycine/betaine/sarcosine/D-proline family reductase selenoprotein B n=1 Tax=Clostridium sardiniense TaxID=29369 RepID=A0ABS7KSX9_CLOSR|nr:GrdB-related putative oxidoreductase [Clostridium sardiniense]MBY0753906.1 glycine/betaine/sarcosine/D-proline family reductase selenoprotein B [Clostridium sardiniense]MDQ0459579.1 glycine reductase [Clostridium sardiniense]